MSNSMKKIYIRVITKRIADGETIDDILSSYPKLTDEEKTELKKEFE
jgi:uncharacterized protein (DUF433 family)